MTFYDRLAKLSSTESVDFPGVYEVAIDTYEPPAPASVIYGADQKTGHLVSLLGNSAGFSEKAPRHRWTELDGSAVSRLYNAMSFLTWNTGLCFNAHVTLSASALGFRNHKEFVSLLPQWHKEMNRFLFDGENTRLRSTRKTPVKSWIGQPKHERVSHPHYWIQVVEYARDHGFHVHVLCVVPKHAEGAFLSKATEWWHTQSPGWPESNGIACKFRYSKRPTACYEQQVYLLRYIIKSASERESICDAYGNQHSLRAIFKPEPNDCTPVMVEVPQLYGISNRLNHGARKKAGFSSKFDEGFFDEIYSGWEFDARRKRAEELERRQLLDSLLI